MKVDYKVKKRYPHNKLNNEFYCEARTRLPGANVKIVVHSWSNSIHMSMNGTLIMEPDTLPRLQEAVEQARVEIKRAQDGQ